MGVSGQAALSTESIEREDPARSTQRSCSPKPFISPAQGTRSPGTTSCRLAGLGTLTSAVRNRGRSEAVGFALTSSRQGRLAVTGSARSTSGFLDGRVKWRAAALSEGVRCPSSSERWRPSSQRGRVERAAPDGRGACPLPRWARVARGRTVHSEVRPDHRSPPVSEARSS